MSSHFTKSDRSRLRNRLNPYRKSKPTVALRIEGPFTCETVDGNTVECEDGWLAFDDEGYPYPIAASVFERSYTLDKQPTKVQAVRSQARPKRARKGG